MENRAGKKRLAVLLGANEKYDMALANVIIGLKRYSEELIDNIIVFCEMSDSTIEKLRKIWAQKLIFIPYTFADFTKDLGLKEGEKYFDARRFSHFMYVKFYIFKLLEEYQNVVWLDCDVLVCDNIERILCEKGVDIQARLARHGNILIENTAKSLAIPLKDNYCYMKEGVISVNESLLEKVDKNIDIVKECFRLAYMLYVKNIIPNASGSDGIPWNVLVAQYGIKWKGLMNKGDTWQYENDSSTCVIHMAGEQKVWGNPIEFISFQEWFVNYKIWIKNFYGAEKLNLSKTSLPIHSSSSLYKTLRVLEIFYPMCEKLSLALVRNFNDFKFFFETSSIHNGIVKIVPYGKSIHYRITFNALPWYQPYSCGLVVPKSLVDIYRSTFGNIDIADIKSKEEADDFYFYFFADYRNIDLLVSQFTRFIKSTCVELHLQNTKLKPLQTNVIFDTATHRIHSHLAYKLGSAMILNSKSFLGYIRMPYVLSYIKEAHQKEQKEYQAKITKNPKLKLPKLESYADYKEALKEKECFTYKLGQALIAANSVRGGGQYLLTLPFSKRCVG